MSIKTGTLNKILEKAKLKNDGCYRYGGVAYRVVGGRVTHVGNFGEIYERCRGWLVKVGSYEWSINSDEAAQKILRGIK